MSEDASRRAQYDHRLVRMFSLAVGIVFVLVGIAGFIPGLTEGVGEMTFAGPDSDAFLFGVFAVSILHNLVHLLFGVAGIAAAARATASRGYLIVGGGVYLLLWIYGVGTHDDSAANFVPLNSADDWLHLGLGLGMIGLGVLATAVERRRAVYPEPPEERETRY